MKTFKVSVTVEHQFEITIDETIWDLEALRAYSEVMSPVNDLEDVATLVAEEVAKNDECTMKGVQVKVERPPYYNTEIEN
jgi:hypothetical protein